MLRIFFMVSGGLKMKKGRDLRPGIRANAKRTRKIRAPRRRSGRPFNGAPRELRRIALGCVGQQTRAILATTMAWRFKPFLKGSTMIETTASVRGIDEARLPQTATVARRGGPLSTALTGPAGIGLQATPDHAEA
jgi:hypothetical protein